MIRASMIALVMIIAFQGLACGQGILDSVLGPGGLGIWGGDSSRQFNPQGYNDQPPGPQQQQQYYPPQGQQPYSPQQYGPQQGVNADWYNQPPAAGSQGAQYGSAPQQYPEQQQYGGQPQYQQYPPQQPYQQQMPPQQGYAPPQGQYAAPQQVAPQRLPQQQLRPGQYTQAPPAQGPGQGTADDLPAGAVRIMTTTPDGTTVQYYPPSGEPDAEGAVRPQRQRKPAGAKPSARQKQSQQQADQSSVVQSQQGTAPIAMPKPVEMPKQDPRYGWGAAVDRAPSAPPAR